MIILLSDKYKHDVLESAISRKDVLSDLKDFITRLNLINELINKKDYGQFHEAINRIIRIIKNEKVTEGIKESLLTTPEEIRLWNEAQKIDENILTYPELISELQKLVPYISEFFEKVLVMDKDEIIKQNRINMLNKIKQKFDKIGDFSKITY